jgi:hypothetical protein
MNYRLLLLNKLLEDGNTLFRNGRYDAAAYRYEYALKRMPRLKTSDASQDNKASQTKNNIRQKNIEREDVFTQLKVHLLLNLSRTKRKHGVRQLYDVLKQHVLM